MYHVTSSCICLVGIEIKLPLHVFYWMLERVRLVLIDHTTVATGFLAICATY